ncbi:MAG TPA: N-acetylmuramoyl-L-alanine amidase [Phnomibacter sp.]|nr:N-acetylmuramoyl-L-alanine amidase [Phnomibacter sp.]
MLPLLSFFRRIMLICPIISVTCGFSQGEMPLFIKTAGKLPQLAWSTGTDRLGSAKMGYIDTGIVMEVADTMGGLYKVRLSQNRHAYLDKALAKPAEVVMRPGVTTTGSWRVKGGDGPDSLSISLGRKVPYQSRMELHPARIIVELYGVQANTNWITQLGSAREIKQVDHRQAEDDVVEVTIYLKHAQPYGYRLQYQGNSLLLTVRVPPDHRRLRGKTIVVDAGHGGTNTGARGVNSGMLEKDLTLLFAKELEKALKKKGATVLMVRDRDTTIDNKDRVLWAIGKDPDLFVSIHLNSAGRATARGVSTYYKSVGFRSLSETVLDELLDIKGLEAFGLVGSFNFQPVQPTEFPSTLVEVAFLSNPEDEKMILDGRFRTRIAKQIRAGIKEWYKDAGF